jgi:hypothetical protein
MRNYVNRNKTCIDHLIENGEKGHPTANLIMGSMAAVFIVSLLVFVLGLNDMEWWERPLGKTADFIAYCFDCP